MDKLLDLHIQIYSNAFYLDFSVREVVLQQHFMEQNQHKSLVVLFLVLPLVFQQLF
jgi:hypothetical protein